jgi:hypothetical protein
MLPETFQGYREYAGSMTALGGGPGRREVREIHTLWTRPALFALSFRSKNKACSLQKPQFTSHRCWQ